MIFVAERPRASPHPAVEVHPRYVAQLSAEYYAHSDGREERLVHAFALRYLFRFEAEHLLARAGFSVEQVYSGFDKGEYGSVYPGELVFVARKTLQTSPSGS